MENDSKKLQTLLVVLGIILLLVLLGLRCYHYLLGLPPESSLRGTVEGFWWPVFLAWIISIFAVVLALRRKKEGSSRLAKVSKFLYVLHILGLIVFIGTGVFLILLGQDASRGNDGAMYAFLFFFYLFFLPATFVSVLSGLGSAFYYSSKERFLFQKSRNITLIITSVLLGIVNLGLLTAAIIEDYKTGMIGGISAEEALEIAKKEVDPRIRTAGCEIEKNYPVKATDKYPAAFFVYCDVYYGNTDKIFMRKKIVVNAKDGKEIIFDDYGYRKMTFKITKNGLPLANTHYFSVAFYTAGDSNREFGEYLDYGVPNQDGTVNLLVRSGEYYMTRIYNLRGEYLDLNIPEGQQERAVYELDWSQAVLPPAGSLTLGENSIPSNLPYGQGPTSVRFK